MYYLKHEVYKTCNKVFLPMCQHVRACFHKLCENSYLTMLDGIGGLYISLRSIPLCRRLWASIRR